MQHRSHVKKPRTSNVKSLKYVKACCSVLRVKCGSEKMTTMIYNTAERERERDSYSLHLHFHNSFQSLVV